MRARLALALLAVLSACTADAPPPPLYPGVDALEEDPALPDLFQGWQSTRRATTPEAFATWRSDELRALFAHYVYGEVPAYTGRVEVVSLAHHEDFFDGRGTYDELEVGIRPGATKLHLAVFTPAGRPVVATVLGPNRCGNGSVASDPRIRETTTWVPPACVADGLAVRGGSAAIWPVETLLERGVALATFHESDAEPDEGGEPALGLRGTYLRDDGSPYGWGTISVWSFAVSRALDALAAVPAIDVTKVAVFGNSRRGKTALWAAANDPRIAMVLAHQSGTAGAALARSHVGENIQAITSIYPLWFNEVFPTFAGAEDKLPIDQHQLVALVAPRPVLLTDGDDDTWADPIGAKMAAEAASPAWALFGVPGMAAPGSDEGRLVWRSRPGGHAVLASDWQVFLDFTTRHARP